jgi:hypothetical protein
MMFTIWRTLKLTSSCCFLKRSLLRKKVSEEKKNCYHLFTHLTHKRERHTTQINAKKWLFHLWKILLSFVFFSYYSTSWKHLHTFIATTMTSLWRLRRHLVRNITECVTVTDITTTNLKWHDDTQGFLNDSSKKLDRFAPQTYFHT